MSIELRRLTSRGSYFGCRGKYSTYNLDAVGHQYERCHRRESGGSGPTSLVAEVVMVKLFHRGGRLILDAQIRSSISSTMILITITIP
jgi:hypothetical protein